MAHDIINLERRFDLLEDVRELDGTPLPDGVSCYLACDPNIEERTYGTAMTDDYDVPLRSVTAAALLTLADHEGVTDNWRNRAAWAYLACLPPDWPVVLFWS